MQNHHPKVSQRRRPGVGRRVRTVPQRPGLVGPDRHRDAAAGQGDSRAAAGQPRGAARAGRRLVSPVSDADGAAGVGAAGVVTKVSPREAGETVARLLELLDSKGLKVFAVIDQQAEARAVGLDLRETTLVIFGNPAAGTGVMVASPLAALDLPLKVLVWAETRPGHLRELHGSGHARLPVRPRAPSPRRHSRPSTG